MLNGTKYLQATNLISGYLLSKLDIRFLKIYAKTHPNHLIFEMTRGTEETFLQTIHTDGHQVHEKMLNITKHQGNANQNHNQVSPHTC